MSSDADRISRLEEKLDEIVQLLRILALRELTEPKKGDLYPSPVNPYVPPVMPADPGQPWQPYTPPSVPSLDPVTVCSKCGMQFSGVTGYVCQDPMCPQGLGPITC